MKTAKKVPVEGGTRCSGCGDKIKTGGDEWQWAVTEGEHTYFVEEGCADASGNVLMRDGPVVTATPHEGQNAGRPYTIAERVGAGLLADYEKTRRYPGKGNRAERRKANALSRRATS